MTQIAIKEQVKAIRKATENALKSKEAAKKFLVDVEILRESQSKQSKKGDK